MSCGSKGFVFCCATRGYRASIRRGKNPSGDVLFKVQAGMFKTTNDAMAMVLNLRKFADIDALAIAGNQ
jgi:hypothetical protein